MRRLHRFLALVTILSMLRVTAASGQVVCAEAPAQHDSVAVVHSDAASHMSAEEHAMMTASSGDVHGASDSAPSSTPQQPCCDAMATCSNGGAVPSVHHGESPLIERTARIREPRSDMRTSFAPAPEPPPPKG